MNQLMEQMEKNLPSGDADKDFAKIVEFAKATVEEIGQFNPSLFTLSKKEGIIVSKGDIPNGREAKEQMFNELGEAIASELFDVEMFIMIYMGRMRIETIENKDKKIEIENNANFATKAAMDSITDEETVIVVSAKKINGEYKTNFYPFKYKGGQVVWMKAKEPISKINTMPWFSHNKKPGENETFKNPLLEFIYNGYKFTHFCDSLKKPDGN